MQLMQVPIQGYENFYEIDTQGRVFSIVINNSYRGKQIKPYVKSGYHAVDLYKDKKCRHFYVHRLVAEAFIPNVNGYKEVNHKNCDHFDNSVENLEWCNRRQNLEHSYRMGKKRTGENHGMHKLSQDDVQKIRKLIGKIPQKEIAVMFSISQSTISAIKVGRLWKGGDANVEIVRASDQGSEDDREV